MRGGRGRCMPNEEEVRRLMRLAGCEYRTLNTSLDLLVNHGADVYQYWALLSDCDDVTVDYQCRLPEFRQSFSREVFRRMGVAVR